VSTSRPHPQKAALRRAALARRAAMGPAAQAEASRRIHAVVTELPAFQAARGVHCYLSMAGEVATGPLFETCRALGKTTFAPYQDRPAGRLGWAPWAPGDPVARGPMDVPEPARRLAARPEAIDLVLVPGVAFDRTGTRLGFGKGFYDEFLARLRSRRSTGDAQASAGPIFVALAFGVQMVEWLPRDPWDVAMDAIATEGGALTIQG